MNIKEFGKAAVIKDKISTLETKKRDHVSVFEKYIKTRDNITVPPRVVNSKLGVYYDIPNISLKEYESILQARIDDTKLAIETLEKEFKEI